MKLLLMIPFSAAIAGCMSAARHQQELGSTHERNLTLGLVQKHIKPGMAQADVATTLGSPNIVSGDNQNRETWIYDKVASEASFSQDSGGAGAQLTGWTDFSPIANEHFSGTANSSYNKQAGAASFTQRTLTVVIKFTATNTVETVSYNSTRF